MLSAFAAKKPDAEDLEFSFAGDNEYYTKGSKEWDAEELMAKRRMLRRSMKIQGAVLKFWQLMGKRPDETADFTVYSLIHSKITAVLAPDMDEDEAKEAALEDWVEDVAGEEEISLAQYARGLFSVADLWTDSVIEKDYVEFLTKREC